MTDEDEVRGPARRALYRIGYAPAILLRPWADIRARARWLQRRRVAVGVVIVTTLLTGAGAANALVARRTPDSAARDDGTPTIGTTTGTASTTTPTRETAPAATAVPAGSELPPPGVPDTTDTEPSTTVAVLAPYDEGAAWTSHTTTDTPQVAVAGAIVLHASVTNTGTQAFETSGYGSIGVACDQLPDAARNGIDARVGAFLDFVVIQPGETHTFTVTLTAPDYVGRLTCGVGLAYHGDAFAAGPTFGPDDATVDVAPAPDTSTTAVPTTSPPAPAGA
jgi:hypothetical protein